MPEEGLGVAARSVATLSRGSLRTTLKGLLPPDFEFFVMGGRWVTTGNTPEPLYHRNTLKKEPIPCSGSETASTRQTFMASGGLLRSCYVLDLTTLRCRTPRREPGACSVIQGLVGCHSVAWTVDPVSL